MHTKLKVLILEDSKTDAELIQRELKKDGIDFSALVTDSEKSFTEALTHFIPDIILSDHSLPGFNSIEALAICKNLNLNIPFILVTGAVSEEFAVECIKAGADDYILKDKLIRLPAAVINALNHSKAKKLREKAINDLEEQNIFMNLLLKSIPIAHYVSKDSKHNINYISNNVFSFSGYHPQQLIDDPTFWVSKIHPNDKEEVLKKLNNIDEYSEWEIEYRWMVSDNTYRWIFDRAKVITPEKIDTKTQLAGTFIAGAMMDITLRKEAEEKLILKNNELNTFIYRSTHDLRGPLMTILGLTNVALDEEELDELRNYISMINECTHKLDDVLLSLITTISIKNSIKKTIEVNITKIINTILSGFNTINGFNKIKFFLDIKVKNKLITDEFAIISILKNIIENAIKYKDTQKENQSISIFIYDTDILLKIFIKDNGIGIPERFRSKVFDMFFRGTQICKGSGLGLYVVKNAVEKLNGSIQLASTEGTGTTVEVNLPIQKL